MNIPNEAIDAVAKKLFQSTMDEPWEAAYPAQEEHFRDRARGILEAAAPSMRLDAELA